MGSAFPQSPSLAVLRALPAAASLAAHGLVALAFLLGMPGGFPLDHPRFIANRALPILYLALLAAGLASRRVALVRLGAFGLAGFYLGVALVGSALFPVTFGAVAIVCLFASAAHVAAGLLASSAHRGATALATVAGLGVGGIAVATQRAPAPSAHPLGEVAGVPQGAQPVNAGDEPIVLTDAVWLSTAAELIHVDSAGRDLAIAPLLTFYSRSPDGFWTIFQRQTAVLFVPVPPILRSEAGLSVAYRDAGAAEPSSVLTVLATPEGADIDASTVLGETIYGHLNSFVSFTASDLADPFIAFSSSPDVRVPITPSDYPVGRPVTVGWLGEDGTFHVSRAANAEKGPYTDLAAGPLSDGVLVFTIYDGDIPVWRISLDDFASQASTELSPTAGWGLPQNAVELFRVGDAVEIVVTLAGTGVGRGWDSVAHAAGVYRNRVRVERL